MANFGINLVMLRDLLKLADANTFFLEAGNIDGRKRAGYPAVTAGAIKAKAYTECLWLSIFGRIQI